MIPDATSDSIVTALELFDSELRGTGEWENWETKESYKWALSYEDKLYPIKMIVELATGTSRTSYDATNARAWIEKRGFTAVPLRLQSNMRFLNVERLDALIHRFQERYVDFNDTRYLIDERNYKIEAAQHVTSFTDKNLLSTHIANKTWEEGAADIRRALNKDNLLNSYDKTDLSNIPHDAIVPGLYNLLFSTNTFESRFTKWCTLLSRTHLRWGNATYFLMMHYPDEHIFIKPVPFKKFIASVGANIKWDTKPKIASYLMLQTLAQELLTALIPLGARDMIDVQSFIWVVANEPAATSEPEPSEDVDIPPHTEPMPESPIDTPETGMIDDDEDVAIVSESEPSAEEQAWLDSIGATNETNRQWILSLLKSLRDEFGQLLEWKFYPRTKTVLPQIWAKRNGRWFMGISLRNATGLWLWVDEGTERSLEDLRSHLSKPSSIKPRVTNGIQGHRFIAFTQGDINVVVPFVRRLVARPVTWPSLTEGRPFVVIHGADNAIQQYGATYSFSNYAGGAHKQLSDALTAWQNGGPRVRLIIYRPAPYYAFTAWADVTAVETKAGDATNQTYWVLTLEHHELPVDLSLQGESAAPLINQIPWLQKGLAVAFKGQSIRVLSPDEYEAIISEARERGGELPTPPIDKDTKPTVIEFPEGMQYWRFQFPRRYWAEARELGMIGIEWPIDSNNVSVQRLKRAKVGDGIFVYLQRGLVGGVGVITHPYTDIRLEPNSPLAVSAFGGEYPQRIGVRWLDIPAEPVDKQSELQQPHYETLYNRLRNTHTVWPLTKEVFTLGLELLGIREWVSPPIPEPPTLLPESWEQASDFITFVATLTGQGYSAQTLYELAQQQKGFKTSDPETLVQELQQFRLIRSVGKDAYSIRYVLDLQDADNDRIWLARLAVFALLVASPVTSEWILASASSHADVGFVAEYDFARLFDIDGADFAIFSITERTKLIRWYEEVGLVTTPTDDNAVKSFVITLFQQQPDLSSKIIADWNHFVRLLRAKRDNKQVGSATLSQVANLDTRFNELGDHILIDDSVVRRIYRSLLAGRHVVLSGPPGTGKTQLAKLLPKIFWKEEPETHYRLGLSLDEPPVVEETIQRHGYLPVLVTATEDWGIRDVVGGIAPRLNVQEKGIQYAIHHGHLTRTLLRHYAESNEGKVLPATYNRVDIHDDDKQYRGAWLVVDEFTRAPVDAAFGALLTTLSGSDKAFLSIPTGDFGEVAIPLPADFRILGTLNSFDRHFLNQMSEALKRRFDFIDVPPPDASLAEYEQGIAVFQALDRVADSFEAVTHSQTLADSTVVPPRWDGVIAVEPTQYNGRRRYRVQPYDGEDPIGPFLQTFWDFFSVLRLYRQFGTAQAIAVYINLFAGKLVGMEWLDALDTALADTLADQLQVLNREEAEILLRYVDNATDGAAFTTALNAYVQQLPPARQQALHHTLREAEKARFDDEQLPTEAKTALSVEAIARLFPVALRQLPRKSVFRRRLYDLIHERGL